MWFKRVLQVALAVLIFFVCVPMAAVSLGGILGEGEDIKGFDNLKDLNFANKIETPKTIEVWRCDKEKTVKVDFEEYVACVVASEMPATFEAEALKAQ